MRLSLESVKGEHGCDRCAIGAAQWFARLRLVERSATGTTETLLCTVCAEHEFAAWDQTRPLLVDAPVTVNRPPVSPVAPTSHYWPVDYRPTRVGP